MTALLFVVGAYLLGSIPFAIVASKALRLPDPRTYGSNNPGATNVLRTGNKQAAILTLAGDVIKGVVAVLLARHFFVGEQWVVFLVAVAVFLGHVFSVFLHFKGGKGVATALGVLLALNWVMGLVALGIWLAVAAIFRYSSVAALAAALGASIFALLSSSMPNPYVLAAVVMAGLLIWRHTSNIKNLIAGTETRIGGGKRGSEEEDDA
ncbi:MAG TPA: glycerol-3-phosphate 1-O-acyltransferase PlsY [Gallionellaceae bacterium]|nr:glycerol-3-phosphate 1-O-acyltransferase PlsY [Gallionellaceae bacterium]